MGAGQACPIHAHARHLGVPVLPPLPCHGEMAVPEPLNGPRELKTLVQQILWVQDTQIRVSGWKRESEVWAGDMGRTAGAWIPTSYQSIQRWNAIESRRFIMRPSACRMGSGERYVHVCV